MQSRISVAPPIEGLRYHPDFIPREDSDRLLAALLETSAWSRHEVRIAGRTIPCPRLSAWYGDPGAAYTYSGRRYEPLPWTPAILEVRDRIQRALGRRFNGVLLNRYRDGRDGMGWHSDDERELGRDPVIPSVSLGATRRFVLRRRTRGCEVPAEIRPAHGSLIVMSGDMQREWLHSVPKTRCEVGVRINLTFRQLVDQ